MSLNDRTLDGHETAMSTGIFCRGESMRPLFRPGDRIDLVHCRVEDLRRGDVIIFVPPARRELVVHRVVSCGPEGIRTRGDANPYADAWVLRQEHITGRAVFLDRAGRMHPVASGILGRLMIACIRAFRVCDHLSAHVLNPCYRGLARSGLVRRLLPQALRPRVITFERDGTREMQLVLGQRVIGRCTPGEARWTIRRPFRLIVREESLPVMTQAGGSETGSCAGS